MGVCCSHGVGSAASTVALDSSASLISRNVFELWTSPCHARELSDEPLRAYRSTEAYIMTAIKSVHFGQRTEKADLYLDQYDQYD
eukprot:IDg523t1